MPLTVSQFAGSNLSTEGGAGSFLQQVLQWLNHGQPLYMLLYAAGIIFFCFFYTAVVFNPEETAGQSEEKWWFSFPVFVRARIQRIIWITC